MLSDLFISLTLKKLKKHQHLRSLHLIHMEWFLESPADMMRSLASVSVGLCPFPDALSPRHWAVGVLTSQMGFKRLSTRRKSSLIHGHWCAVVLPSSKREF